MSAAAAAEEAVEEEGEEETAGGRVLSAAGSRSALLRPDYTEEERNIGKSAEFRVEIL